MNWFWPNKKTVLDKNKSYLKIQFLTEEQKVKKDLALATLSTKFQDNDQTIIPYEQYFPCSYRFVFNSKEISSSKNGVQASKIMVKQIVANIILSTDQKTKQFYQTYVNGISVIMQNNDALANNDVVSLYDERQVSLYTPQQVIQIIYHQKSLWQRVKNKTKAAIKSIPSILLNFIKKLIGYILVLMGVNNGISSLIWRAVPSKMILQWIGVIVTMFFPALGPILGISKLIL